MVYVLIRSGTAIDPLNPKPEQISLSDIVHPLSNQCRFAGNTRTFYSTAQHAVLVASLVPEEFALHALLLKAPRAYIGDVPAPMQALMPKWLEAEAALWKAIAARYQLDPAIPEVVRHADLVVKAAEKRDLMPHDPTPWPELAGITPMVAIIEPWSHDYAAYRLSDAISTACLRGLSEGGEQ